MNLDLWLLAHAQTATVDGGAATSLDPGMNPVQIIVKYYNFALYLGGAIVFGLVVWGGIQYLAAAGGSGKETGKDRIRSALLGLGLLLGTYLILNFISPGLTVLQLPTLESIKATTSTMSTISAGACNNCGNLAQGSVTCKDPNSCQANQSLVSGVQCLEQKTGIPITVTEGYPPTVDHYSSGHTNGCSIDIKISSSPTCVQVKKIVDSAQGCGLSGVGEYYQVCSSPQDANRYGHKYPTTTGENIHLNGCNSVTVGGAK